MDHEEELEAMARFADWDVDILRRAFCDPSKPVDLAQAYQTAGDYFGWENLDSCPLTFEDAWTLREFIARHIGLEASGI
jgi:hypothetical protein